MGKVVNRVLAGTGGWVRNPAQKGWGEELRTAANAEHITAAVLIAKPTTSSFEYIAWGAPQSYKGGMRGLADPPPPPLSFRGLSLVDTGPKDPPNPPPP